MLMRAVLSFRTELECVLYIQVSYCLRFENMLCVQYKLSKQIIQNIVLLQIFVEQIKHDSD